MGLKISKYLGGVYSNFMEQTIKNINDCEIEILFELSWEEFLPYTEQTCLEMNKNLNIPGFRPGKAPLEMVIREVGNDKVLFSAAEKAINTEYEKFILEKSIEALTTPEIEILKLANKNPFSFKVKTAIFPDFVLPDYKKITSQILKEEVSVTLQEIEQVMEQIKKSKTEFKELETPAEKGNFLEIEYSSPQIENDRVFEDAFFLGQGGFEQGFEENFVGLKKDEEKKFKFVFPEHKHGEHNEHKKFSIEKKLKNDLFGKEIFFKVKIKKVQKARFPELNDDFAKNAFGYQNLAEFKEAIEKEIKKEKQRYNTQKRREEILKKIGEQTKINITKRLLDSEKEQMMEELKQRVKNGLKISFEKYLEQIKKSEQELKETLTSDARKKIQASLILKKIGQKENVAVEQEEIELLTQEFLKNFPTTGENKNIDMEALKEYYKNIIFMEKVFQILDS